MINSEKQSLFEGWDETKKIMRESLLARLGRSTNPSFHPSSALVLPHDASCGSFPAGFDELNKALYRDVHYKFLQPILRAFDYASMAHGVEARTPFLDWRLVTYLFSLPSEMKIGGGYTKRILRKAMRGLMPSDVLWRRSKMGFIESKSYFYNPATVAWMEEVLSSRDFQESGLWNGAQIVGSFKRWKKEGATAPNTGRQLLSVANAHYLTTRMTAASHAAQARSESIANIFTPVARHSNEATSSIANLSEQRVAA